LADVMLNFGMALSLLLLPRPLQAQNSSVLEYRAKANFLSKFPIFIEWPENALPLAHAPFLICVFGDFAFGTSLAEKTRGTAIHEKRVEIRWVHKEQELKSCQILFVSRSEQKKYGQVLEAVRGQGVLTVGETAEFLDAGGIVSFTMQQETLQFDVNLEGANKVHLRISSQMLALARRVVNKTEAAKT
jgi:YfiR/HmsC-like